MKTLAVHRWPGPTPAPQDGLFAILLPPAASNADAAPATTPGASAQRVGARRDGAQNVDTQRASVQRDVARRQIRLAARESLAALLGLAVDDISIASRPGEPPSIVLAGRPCAIGISFSHDDIYSLAAINLQGPIGADIMRVQDIPDWQAVARDYLSPAITASLQALGANERPQAFARAWTAREAQLKLEGRHLSEWTSPAANAEIQSLILPAGMIGAVATRDRPQH